jgi:hypothetical protein
MIQINIINLCVYMQYICVEKGDTRVMIHVPSRGGSLDSYEEVAPMFHPVTIPKSQYLSFFIKFLVRGTHSKYAFGWDWRVTKAYEGTLIVRCVPYYLYMACACIH